MDLYRIGDGLYCGYALSNLLAYVWERKAPPCLYQTISAWKRQGANIKRALTLFALLVLVGPFLLPSVWLPGFVYIKLYCCSLKNFVIMLLHIFAGLYHCMLWLLTFKFYFTLSASHITLILIKLKDVVDYYDLGLTEVHSHKQENKIFTRDNNI